jgi:pyruvate dehydrogenase E1 component
MSDTRPALRRHFRIDAASIVLRVLQELAASGVVDAATLRKAETEYEHAPHDDTR